MYFILRSFFLDSHYSVYQLKHKIVCTTFHFLSPKLMFLERSNQEHNFIGLKFNSKYCNTTYNKSIDIILHYVTHLRSNLSRKTLLWRGLSFYLWANCVFAHKIRWIFFMEADSAQQFSPINEHFSRLSLAWDRNSQFYVLHFTTNVRE